MSRARALAIATLTALAVWAVVRAQDTPENLQQLVAPIALYPDEVVAEVLAAATYPTQIDDAAHWLQQSASLTGDALATAVDQMGWDDSVKALTEFPMILANMDQNLSWASALGDAYYNQPNDVMDAVQALRRRAMAAGTLQSNSQITVSTVNGTIVIEPATNDTVYVPEYDAWSMYGAPINPWPEFVLAPGLTAGARIHWNVGIRIGGVWGRMNWGLRNWGTDWSHRHVVLRRDAYVSHSPSVVDRRPAPRPEIAVPRPPPGQPERPNPPAAGQAVRRPAPAAPAPTGQAAREGTPAGRAQVRPAPVVGRVVQAPLPPKPPVPPTLPPNPRNDRGFPQAKPTVPPSGTRSGAFSGFNHGGTVSNNAAHGRTSVGAAPPKPPPPPPPPRGRGRGGQ
jgi:hypothetical protein